MKYFLLFFFSIVLSISSFSQSKEELSQLPLDAIKDTIHKYQFSDIEKALNATAAYTLKGERENDKDEEWFGRESTIMVYAYFRKYEHAKSHGEKALAFARENNLPKLEMHALLLLGDFRRHHYNR